MSSAPNRFLRALLLPALLLAATPLVAQQTGEIHGTVKDSAGAVLPGATIQATSNVLPRARETVSGAGGEYRLPALPPGTYTLTFNLSGMQAVTRTAQVLLAQQTRADATLGVAGITEAVTVTAEVSLIDKDSATIKSSLASQEIMGLPVGQEYRDLQKLIPGVQFSQDQVRGPSAGGSGQDNVYQFDGVNVNLPLFGTLSAEPASHDIAEVTVVKGGARAVDFDRSGGFSIDTVSRSGTSDFHGQVGYQFQSDAMSADLDSGSLSRYERNLDWLTANLGGPIVKDYSLLLRLLLSPDPGPGQPVQPLRGAARLREHAQRVLRQADLHADADAPPERELPGLEARGHRVDLRLERLAHHRHGERLPPQDLHRRRLLGRQPLELRHLQVHPLREPDHGHPGFRRRPDPQPESRHDDRRGQPRHDRAPHTGADTGVRPDRLQRVHPAHHRPVRLQRERGADRRRHRGLRLRVQRPGLLPRRRADRLQPDPRHERPARAARGVPVVPGRGGARPQLERLGPHLGARRAAHRPDRGEPPEGLLHRPHPAAVDGPGGADQVAVPLPEHRAQRHDQVEQLDVQPRHPLQQRHALRAGAARGLVHPLRVRLGPGQPLQDVRARLGRHDPAPRLRHLGLQQQGHRLRGLGALQPRGELAAPRGLVGPQPDRSLRRRPLRPERRPLRVRAGGLVLGQAVRRRHDAAHDRRVPPRHREAAWPALVRPPLRPLPRERPLLGGHQQQRAGRLQPPARDPPRALHPRPRRRSSRRSAAGPPT